MRAMSVISEEMDRAESKCLLGKINRFFSTQIGDVIIATMSVWVWCHFSSPRTDLGYSRERIDSNCVVLRASAS